jgi:arylsulfatase A-like enzyme
LINHQLIRNISGIIFLAGATGNFNLHGQKVNNPNIVLILADDLGYGDVSSYNANSRIKTSNIDSVASRGLIFKDAHSNSSVSTPTRYGILTGRYCWRTSLQEGVLDGYSDPLIPEDRLTIASMLRLSGYNTAYIGKWHLGLKWARKSSNREDVDYTRPFSHGPLSLGFDYFFGISGSLDMPPYVYLENKKIVGIPDSITENNSTAQLWRKGPVSKDFRHRECLPIMVQKAISYLNEKASDNKSFFLYLALPAPHTPILPLSEFKGKSGIGEYGDYVLEVDHFIGDIVKCLKENKLFDNTIFIITSDNGCSPAAGTKELEKLGHFPSAQFRGYKADLYEGGHREPLIISWPKKIKREFIGNQLISLTDLMATFAELTGFKLSDNQAEDSFSFFPLLLNPSSAFMGREAMVQHSYYGNFAIRKGDWELLLTPYSGGWGFPQQGIDDGKIKSLPKFQLYNLKNDPGERNNLYNNHRSKAKQLKKLMIRYIKDGRSTPGKIQKNDGQINYEF